MKNEYSTFPPYLIFFVALFSPLHIKWPPEALEERNCLLWNGKVLSAEQKYSSIVACQWFEQETKRDLPCHASLATESQSWDGGSVCARGEPDGPLGPGMVGAEEANAPSVLARSWSPSQTNKDGRKVDYCSEGWGRRLQQSSEVDKVGEFYQLMRFTKTHAL